MIIFLCIFFAMIGTAQSATYWVSPSGSNGNACNTSASPLTTTAKRTIQAGVACYRSRGRAQSAQWYLQRIG